jgi:hypothetical protein
MLSYDQSYLPCHTQRASEARLRLTSTLTRLAPMADRIWHMVGTISHMPSAISGLEVTEIDSRASTSQPQAR